jgi:hypothetical protein
MAFRHQLQRFRLTLFDYPGCDRYVCFVASFLQYLASRAIGAAALAKPSKTDKKKDGREAVLETNV